MVAKKGNGGNGAARRARRSRRTKQGGLPILIRTEGATALVVGGGRVATRKIRVLLASGAKVVCVAPRVGTRVRDWAHAGRIVWRARRFRTSDLDEKRLVVTATDSPELASEVALAAKSRGVLSNAAENPEAGDCFFPASRRAGDYLIAVSTLGKSPGAAKKMADRLSRVAGR